MPTHEVEVLAIGTASYDLSIFVDGFPRENSKLEIPEMLEGGGGPAANAAYLLSRWGVKCAFAGVLGNDMYGQRIAAEFEAAGTDFSLVEVREGHPTPLSVVLVNTLNGSRTIVNRKARLGALELSAARLAEFPPQVLLFDGHEFGTARLALELFGGAVSILDAGSLRPGTEGLAGRVDYLVASERFAHQVTGLPDLANQNNCRECLRRMRDILRPGAIIVVTLGENGLIYEAEGACRHLPAYPARVVDTTAAGDIFHGAFAYGVLKKLSLEHTLKLACAASSLSVRQRGGRQSTPSLDNVRKALRDAEGTASPGLESVCRGQFQS
jgi:sugar/nucleoside kinase (ribokinase family)